MEKGIEAEEDNLYEQTDNVADNVLNSLEGVKPNVYSNIPVNSAKSQELDYNKLFNVLYEAFIKALNSCKLTLDEDGFAKIVKDELYKVV